MTVASKLTRWLMVGAMLLSVTSTSHAADHKLQAAVAAQQRNAKNVVRDRYRHPYAALRFFGVTRRSHVVEILPGGGYWTEILAPYLKAHGSYTAAIPANGGLPEQIHERVAFQQFQADDPARYGKIAVVDFAAPYDVGPPESADMILTFRNLHNWMKRGDAEAVFQGFYRSLKPGGILGIEDHRATTDRPQDPLAKDGYVREDYAITLIEKAGFKLAAKSAIGANPKDTKDYPAGVWTLPPTLKLGDKDRAKYLAIGESDRFTLKFVKPAP